MFLPTNPLGSQEWASEVMNAPPVRNLKGHAKYTQGHRTSFQTGGEFVDTQGASETVAALVLAYLRNLGSVGRFKAQPFFTVKEVFGLAICPDFFVELLLPKPTYFVVEVKTEAYLDDELRTRLDEIRLKFMSFGLPYLVWTDRKHLGNNLYLNLDSARMYSMHVPESEIQALASWLMQFEATTIGNAVRAGFTLDVIDAAVWRGKAYRPLRAETRYDMLLTSTQQVDMVAEYFQVQGARTSWWSRYAKEVRAGAMS